MSVTTDTLAQRRLELAARRAALSAHKQKELDALLQKGAEASVPARVIPVSHAGATAPLSFAQERLWFLEQLEPGTTAYNVCVPFRIAGRLSVSALAQSINEMIRRQEVLRTAYMVVDGKPVQVLSPWSRSDLPVVDLQSLPAARHEGVVQQLISASGKQTFDLANGPILRTSLIRLNEEEHVLLIALHHISFDEWSMRILLHDTAQIYKAFVRGAPSALEELPIQYRDFAHWQRQWLQGDVLDREIDFWRQQLEGSPPVLALPWDRPRSAITSSKAETVSFELSPELSAGLVDLTEAAGSTPFITLLAAFQLLLSRYTGQFDIPVGTPVAGRRWVETEGMIGFFVNTLVLRTKLDGNPTIREMLNRVREVALEAQTHQDLPFEKLVEELQPERNLNQTPLFQVMFGFQNARKQRETIPGLTVTPVDAGTVTAKFDLTLSMNEGEKGITGELEYNSDLFKVTTIDRLLAHYRTLLEAMVDDPDQRLSDVEILSDTERQRLLVEWNETRTDYPREQCLPELFEGRVEHSPDAIALVSENQQLTYRDLNRRANQLAHYLQELGVDAETRVGICLRRTPQAIIAMLGVLKAGAAYFAQDVGQPRERLLFMLEDCGVKFLLTEPDVAEQFSDTGLHTISLKDEWETIEKCSTDNPSTQVSPDNLACVIYTSGSTGNPKGVMVTQRSLTFYAHAAAQMYDISAADRVLQFTSLGVDASIEEIYPILTQGGGLVLRDEEMMASASDFLSRCGHLGITLLSMPTAWFHVLTSGKDVYEWWERASSVRLVTFGGDRVLPERVREFVAHVGDRVRLINSYGPTETTVVSTIGEYDRDHSFDDIGIGRPIANTLVYIVDKSLRSVPVGVSGELLIGGDGVARGYLSRPDLTAQQFMPNPFASIPGDRVYRTGDHVRYLPSGNIEFFGRRDHQVKIRGFRIETGEIEAALRTHDAVKEAAVIASEERRGEKRLVAYVVWNDPAQEQAGIGALREYLKHKLPGHMMPSFFVVMDELPLTAYRKVDRHALPKPDGLSEWSHLYIAPRTPVEEMLAGIWANVLGVDQVGVEDNFFDVGGHSLLATQLISRIRETFAVELPLRALFEQATVASLAERVEQLWRGGPGMVAPQLSPVDRSQPLPLSFAQQRLWFLDQLEPGSPLYNIPEAVQLSGPLDIHALEHSINELIRRHEGLRTCFVSGSGGSAQVIVDNVPRALEVEDLTTLAEETRREELQRLLDEEAQQPFDLAHGPLLRVRLFRLSAEEHVLAVTMHHIISDEWSMRILQRELGVLYESYRVGTESPLAELRIQYADYAVWQRNWLQGEVLERELSYWRKQLAGAPALLELPADRARPAVQTHRGAYQRVRLSAETTRAMKELSRRHNATLFMTVLAGFQALLSRWSGTTDVVVGTPVAGRTQGETEAVIGFFVNTLALRTDLSENPTFSELVKRVREVCLGGYAHQEVPFEKLVEELGVERDLSRTPLFQVMLAWQNAGEEELELSGLRMVRVEEDLSSSRAKFDLLLSLGEFHGEIGGTLEYNVDLFHSETIERVVAQLERVLAAVAGDEECRVGELPLLSEAEREQVVVEWNRGTPYPVQGSVIARFEREVERRPESIAVKFEDEEVSYGELNRRANQLAHYLRRHGVGPEVRVGLLLERSVAMVVSVLAVLKAGGAYVPLELAAPAERIAFMLEDSGCALLLANGEFDQSDATYSGDVLKLESLWPEIAKELDTNLNVPVHAENVAYVIYTSGSTGKPKGVMVTHGNVLRLLDATAAWFGFGSEDVWTMFHSYAFDFSVWELWGALLYGGKLVVVPYWVSRTPEAYYELLQREQVTVLNQTPSAFRQLQPLLEQTPVERLRVVIFGGEALELSSLQSWYERYGERGPQMVNMYGITETTVHVTYRLLSAADVVSGRGSLIGRRIPDLELYLLDEQQEPVPVGVAGELYVGGGGVARGYLNRAELTAQRFIPHPFSSEAGARLYRTGDLGRYLADGDVEYLGRVDQQVKIRGYRIETGEVAAALRSHEAVAAAVVVAWSDNGGEQRLVGYVVPRSGVELQATELRNHMRERLPDYMVPAYLVQLESLPLTANGKLDRRQLPAPQTETLSRNYEPPNTVVEEKLAAVWAEVLGTDRVGIKENFFALGGDSIRSVRVLALAREQGLQFSLQQLFQYQTIAELAGVVSESAIEGQLTSSEPFSLIRAEDREQLGPEIEDAYPLSMLQAGMLFHSEYERQSSLYHNYSSFHVRALFDEEALREALQSLVQRHAVLRTSFDLTSYSEPLQLVQRQVEVPFLVTDLSHLSAAEQEAEIAAWQETEKQRYIDWRQAPLLRFQVHRRSAATFQFSFAEHHAILDGWSVAAMLQELFASYQRLLHGEDSENGTPSTLYRDFVALERAALQSEECHDYWREKLSGSSVASLPRWSAAAKETTVLPVPVTPELSDRLKQVAETAGVPIKSVLLAAHLRVMSVVGGCREVLTGVVSHGRPEAIDAERALGLYLNTLPFRLKLSGGSWLDLIRETFAVEREWLPYRYYPMAQIKIDEDGRPLFDTIFNFTHFHVLDVVDTSEGLDVLDQIGFGETDFVLAVDFNVDTGNSHINLALTGAGLPGEQMHALAGYYSAALNAIVADPHAGYDLQPLLSEDELQRLLVHWNNNRANYERETQVHRLFEQQVERTPDSVAIEFGSTQLTYRGLNARANQLAHYLRECGVGAEMPVGICMERSAEMVVALLAILKAGGAYLPLDVDYPAERLSFMMSDSGARLLITQSHLQPALAEHQAQFVITDRDRDLIGRYSTDNLPPVTTPESLAYVIYTSGSTGTPKGIGITLRSILRLVRNTNYIKISSSDVIAQASNASFDAATFEIWGALLHGARLQGVAREVLLTPHAFKSALKTRAIDVVFLTTALFNQMVRHDRGTFATVKHMLFGGEQVDLECVREAAGSGAGPERLLHVYGPTETTTYATWYEVNEVNDGAETVPIGRGIANTDIYVLDLTQQLVPVAAKGELYLGGDGLARGYLNRPELTAEKFVPHPFSDTPGERLYRTGDVVRWNGDGEVEFVGRVDHQVKIRGFRIETGEIEAALSAHESVREVVVIVREDVPGEKRLVAYVACDPETTVQQLRSYLRERKPDYMVPSFFVLLDRLPLNANGKVDRSALPEPTPEDAFASEAYVAPRTPAEQRLAGIWARVLGIERIGINDNFFDLGGHSLLATQLISRIREDFDMEMPLVHLFENPTVASFAEIVDSIWWARQEDGVLVVPGGEEYEEGAL